MEQVQQSSTEKRKPGPKPKVKEVVPEPVSELEQLKERISMLESCLERVATLTGNGNILMQFGLKRWVPGKSDLSKYTN